VALDTATIVAQIDEVLSRCGASADRSPSAGEYRNQGTPDVQAGSLLAER
jgi:hypothetical protein